MDKQTPLKNILIAKEFRISRSTLTRWIKSAQEGKNNLQVAKFGKKMQIIDNQHNREEIGRLAKQGAIFKNKESYKEVEVNSKFYEVFSKDNVIEIYNSLQIARQINQKFNYFGRGCQIWYENQLQNTENTDTNNLRISLHLKIIDFMVQYLTATYPDKSFNIIDLNPVAYKLNAFLIKKLDKEGVFAGYTALDPSADLNRYALNLLVREGLDQTKLSSKIFDTESESLRSILAEYWSGNAINIVTGFYGTINSFGSVNYYLKKLKKEFSQSDLLMVQCKLDMPENRVAFSTTKRDLEIHLNVPIMLGIDVNKCELKNFFNDKTVSRSTFLTLDKDYLINFKALGLQLKLYKGENIIVHSTSLLSINQAINDLEAANFKIKTMFTTIDDNYFMALLKQGKNF